MDFLKAEIASKKRALSPTEGGSSSTSQSANKYMRKGDLERIRREEEEKAEQARKEEQQRKRQEKEAKLFARAKKVHTGANPMVAVTYGHDHTDIITTFQTGSRS